MKKNILFITGTDTHVGKTITTVLLAKVFQKAGLTVQVCKPIMTGGHEDLQFYQEHLWPEMIAQEGCLYSFDQALSPHLASRLSNRPIILDHIINTLMLQASKVDILIVEGIGGILAPITEKLTILDLIVALNPYLLIVAINQLGTINHSLLTILAARYKGITPCGIVFNELANKFDPSQPYNAFEVSQFAKIPIWAAIPNICIRTETLNQTCFIFSNDVVHSFIETFRISTASA